MIPGIISMIKTNNQAFLITRLSSTRQHFFKIKDSQDKKEKIIEFIYYFASNN